MLAEQPGQLVGTDAGLAHDRAERAPVQFAVVWHDKLHKGLVPTKDEVATLSAT